MMKKLILLVTLTGFCHITFAQSDKGASSLSDDFLSKKIATYFLIVEQRNSIEQAKYPNASYDKLTEIYEREDEAFRNELQELKRRYINCAKASPLSRDQRFEIIDQLVIQHFSRIQQRKQHWDSLFHGLSEDEINLKIWTEHMEMFKTINDFIVAYYECKNSVPKKK